MISLILAMDKNNLIGNKGKLPWHIPEDLAYFKKITTGHTVIMGRKTFESIGKILPERENIVITRKKDFNADGCIVVHSVEEVLNLINDKEAFVIGGGEVYELFLPYVERLYITKIEAEFEGDTYFKKFNKKEWKLISKTRGRKNKNIPFKYSFLVYER